MEGLLTERTRSQKWFVHKDYEVLKQIGSGAYGSVYEALYKPENTKCAIKTYKRLLDPKLSVALIQNAREIEILSKLRHEHIVHYLDIIRPTDTLNGDVHLVLELMPHDLSSLTTRTSYLPAGTVKLIMYQLLCAVNYLHSRKIVHRDIKPNNILLDSKNQVRLCDFGLARSLVKLQNPNYDYLYAKDYLPATLNTSEDEDLSQGLDECSIVNFAALPDHFNRLKVPSFSTEASTLASADSSPDHKTHNLLLTTHMTTRYYRAPEIILVESYFSAVDIWSVGCIFAELLQLLEANQYSYYRRKPLFTGISCYPLSPHHAPGRLDTKPLYGADQLTAIGQVLGRPIEEDLAFVTKKRAKERLAQLPMSPRADFRILYPGIGPLEADLLERLLKFNPYRRTTAKEALQHRYFDEVREKTKETEAPPLVLDVETSPHNCAAIVKRMCTNTNAFLYF